MMKSHMLWVLLVSSAAFAKHSPPIPGTALRVLIESLSCYPNYYLHVTSHDLAALCRLWLDSGKRLVIVVVVVVVVL